MRSFIDGILGVIGAASMSDDEFNMITVGELEYTKELYAEMLIVLDSRESVSSDRDRLGHYFKARGIAIDPPAVASKSQIFVGGSLC
jgi:hypothetical protein